MYLGKDVPGPGAYLIPSQFTRPNLAASANQRSRDQYSKDQSTINENSLLLTALQPIDTNSKIQSLLPKRANTTKNDSRDNYSINLAQPYSVKNSNTAGATFTTSKRPQMLMTCTPGPKYDTSQPITHNRKIITTLKQRYQKFLSIFGKGIYDVPGPGKYEITNEVLNPKKGRSFMQSGRNAKEDRIRSLSIDDRATADSDRENMYLRSKSLEYDQINKNPVGPGSYNLVGQIGNPKRGVGFAKSVRYTKGSMFGPEELDELDRIVGPGYYNIKSTIPQLQGWVRTDSKIDPSKFI